MVTAKVEGEGYAKSMDRYLVRDRIKERPHET